MQWNARLKSVECVECARSKIAKTAACCPPAAPKKERHRKDASKAMRFHWLRKDLNMFDTTTRHLTSSHIIIFLTFAVDMKYLILTLCAVFTLTLAFSPNASGIARSHKQAGAELRLFSLENQNDDENSQFSRRSMMRTAVQSASIITLTTLGASEPSYAGLVQFPCNHAMKNTYHVMRAGESLLESQDLLSTNPMLM